MGDPQQHQPAPPPAHPPAPPHPPAHQPAPPHPPAPPARDSGRLPRSRTVLLGALSVAPPAGIVLAIATRWYQFFYGTFGCSVLCVVSFFLGIEAATRGRKELRWPPEIRPRLGGLRELLLGAGRTAAFCQGAGGVVDIAFLAAQRDVSRVTGVSRSSRLCRRA